MDNGLGKIAEHRREAAARGPRLRISASSAATSSPVKSWTFLENTRQGAGGEIQLTDAIATLLERRQVLAYEFTGTRYDCGSKVGYLQATIDYALQHPEVRDDFRAFLRTRAQSL